MLSKEEMASFLRMLLTFFNNTNLSAVAQSELFGISHPTMARWIAAARHMDRTNEVNISAYHHSVASVIVCASRLNSVDTDTGLYARVRRADPAEKLEILRAALPDARV